MSLLGGVEVDKEEASIHSGGLPPLTLLVQESFLNFDVLLRIPSSDALKKENIS